MGQSSFFLTGFDYVTNDQARVVEKVFVSMKGQKSLHFAE